MADDRRKKKWGKRDVPEFPTPVADWALAYPSVSLRV